MKKVLLLLTAASVLFAGTVAYTYDTAGRLIKADYGSAGSITYDYDKAGNLVKRTVTGPATATAAATAKVEEHAARKAD